MADYTREEVIEKVKRGESLAGVDLSGIDLSKLDFISRKDGGPCKRKVDFSNSNLSNIDFSYSNFKDVNFNNTKFESVIFLRSNLTDSKFIKSYGFAISFIDAELKNVDFSFAKLFYADFTCSNLFDIIFKKTDLSFSDFQYAILSNVDFSGSNIYHMTTFDWQIYEIICTHVYNFNPLLTPKIINTEKYREKFEPGEFAEKYKEGYPEKKISIRDADKIELVATKNGVKFVAAEMKVNTPKEGEGELAFFRNYEVKIRLVHDKSGYLTIDDRPPIRLSPLKGGVCMVLCKKLKDDWGGLPPEKEESDFDKIGWISIHDIGTSLGSKGDSVRSAINKVNHDIADILGFEHNDANYFIENGDTPTYGKTGEYRFRIYPTLLSCTKEK